MALGDDDWMFALGVWYDKIQNTNERSSLVFSPKQVVGVYNEHTNFDLDHAGARGAARLLFKTKTQHS